MKLDLGSLLRLLGAAQKALEPLYGQKLDAPAMGNLQTILLRLFKYPTQDSRWAASTVITQYAGKTLSKDLAVTIVCRLCSGKAEIMAGISPSLWEGKSVPAIMFCEGVGWVNTPTGKPSLVLHLRCLAGDPAGLSFEVTLSRAYIEYLLGKQLGLSFKKYNAPAEFITGCFFRCLVEEDSQRARIAEITATGKMKELNKKIADARLSMVKCKTPQLECCFCRKTRKECNLAVWK